MIADKEYSAIKYLQSVLQSFAPYDTGNLALNSIVVAYTGGKWHVYVGGEIADYAYFTNTIGRNAGWIERAIEFSLPTIRQIMSGTLSVQEYEELIGKAENRLMATQMAKAATLRS